MLFTVEIGNTRVHCTLFDGDTLRHSFCISTANRTADEYALTLSSMLALAGFTAGSIDGAVIGSVAPSVTESIRTAIKMLTNTDPLTVGPGVKTGFSIKLDDPSQLGADIAANAAAVITDGSVPAIIADFGTATTVSLINGGGELIGCSILPGVQMSLRALNSTELLPGIFADKKVDTLGKNTVNAMLGGVVRGTAYAVCGLIDDYKNRVGKSASVTVTGGDAPLVLPYLGSAAVYREHLTAEGLAAIYRRNIK